MASSSSFFIIFAFAVLCFVPSISALDHIVGDDSGWTKNFDYQAWAQGKKFHVGDNLVFKYPAGTHSVLKIGDAASFQQCLKPDSANALTTGYDKITLTTPGKKWYVCGVARHCEAENQKLAITVLPLEEGSVADSPSPNSPPPSLSAAGASFGSICYGLMAFVVGVLGMLHMV